MVELAPMKHTYHKTLWFFYLLIAFLCLTTKVVSALPNNWQFSAGLIQLTLPKYQGADQYRVLVVPSFNVKYKKWLFANAYQGLGVNIINNQHFVVGSNIRYNFAGNDERSERFPGLGNINDLVLAGAFFNYKVGLFSAGVSTYRALGSLKGSGYYSSVLGFFLPLNKRFFLRFSLTTRYDDQQYMQGLFGVTADEARRSALPKYNTHAGWQNTSFSVLPIWLLTTHWNVNGVFSAKHFLGQAASSPLIDHSTTYFAGVSVMYNFTAN